MKHVILKMTFLLAVMMAGIGMQAQNTTSGKDFWLSFGDNQRRPTGLLDLQIKVVAEEAATVTFTFTANGSSKIVNIAAGEVYTLILSESQKEAVHYNGLATGAPIYTAITSQSLRIQSDKSVTVYALNQADEGADATNLLPVNTLGKDYYLISYKPSFSDGYAIVATEDGTLVNGSISLQKGQVYSHYGVQYVDEDFTGRHITSNKPIACFVTSNATAILQGQGWADPLFQQMMPVNTWGKKYFVPVTKRTVERVRIIASEDGTVVTHTGGTQVWGNGSLSGLNKGEFVELEILQAEGGCFISADKPVGVCTYMVSAQYSSATLPGIYLPLPLQIGDPSLSLVPPVEQFINKATIAPFIPKESNRTKLNLNEHHALILTTTADRNLTTVSVGGGTPTPLSGGTWTTGANPVYSYYNLPLDNSTQSYTFAHPRGLAVLGYGLGPAESYYYLAASALKDLTATFYVNDTLYSEVNGKTYTFCIPLVPNVDIKAVIENESAATGHLKWFVDNALQTTVTDQLEWNLTLTTGSHTIRMEVIDLSGITHTYETTIIIASINCQVLEILPVNPRINTIKN